MKPAELNKTGTLWENYIGYDIVDVHEYDIGKLHCLWVNDAGEVIFLGVKTGWLALGHTHVVRGDVAGLTGESARMCEGR